MVKHRVSSDFCAHPVFFFPPMAQEPLVGQGLHIVEVSRSHPDTPHAVGLLLTSDQLVAQTSTCQHPTLKKTRPCSRRDSNPQSQEASGHKPTSDTTWSLGSTRSLYTGDECLSSNVCSSQTKATDNVSHGDRIRCYISLQSRTSCVLGVLKEVVLPSDASPYTEQ